jgi:hypothetical protein
MRKTNALPLGLVTKGFQPSNSIVMRYISYHIISYHIITPAGLSCA